MLRGILRILSSTPQTPSLIEPDGDRVLLFAQIDAPDNLDTRTASRTSRIASPTPVAIAGSVPAHVSHRERLFGMRLEYTKLCSPRRCERLRTLGIVTAGDLSSADPDRLAVHFGAPRKALRVLRQYRRAIRFAAAVPGMMPRDAMLLISIHRRSARGLASESPSALHRDLERFAESSQGRLQLRGRRIPSTRRLKRWIAACESTAIGSPRMARAA